MVVRIATEPNLKSMSEMERQVDVAIIGSGTAGLSALSQVRKRTDDFVLIDGGILGTTCARVACMPSKAMIEIARDFRRRMSVCEGTIPQDQVPPEQERAMDRVRALREGFVGSILDNLIEPLGDKLLKEHAEFLTPSVLKVGAKKIRAKKIIIATGSRPMIPGPWARFEDRILTTDTIFEQRRLPTKMAVIGLGAIGLEIGQALADLGVEVTGFDVLTLIGGLEEPKVNDSAVKIFRKKFPLFLGQEAQIEQEGSQLRVTSGREKVTVDKVLVSIGRTPNLERLHLDRLGIELDEEGLPSFDRQTMQVANLPIFIAGDANGYRPVLHEAGHEGKVAGYNATNDPPVKFKRKTRLNIAFSHPNICSVGMGWKTIKTAGPAVGVAHCRGGREKIMGHEDGVIKLFGHGSDGRLLGAEMVAPGGEHLAHMLAWAIQQDLSVFDLLEMPFYHPVVEETLEGALKGLAKKLDKTPGLMRGFSTASG